MNTAIQIQTERMEPAQTPTVRAQAPQMARVQIPAETRLTAMEPAQTQVVHLEGKNQAKELERKKLSLYSI